MHLGTSTSSIIPSPTISSSWCLTCLRNVSSPGSEPPPSFSGSFWAMMVRTRSLIKASRALIVSLTCVFEFRLGDDVDADVVEERAAGLLVLGLEVEDCELDGLVLARRRRRRRRRRRGSLPAVSWVVGDDVGAGAVLAPPPRNLKPANRTTASRIMTPPSMTGVLPSMPADAALLAVPAAAAGAPPPPAARRRGRGARRPVSSPPCRPWLLNLPFTARPRARAVRVR